MPQKVAAYTQEAFAIIGIGLFVFGLWEIYPPAAYIFGGLFLITPFALSLRSK